MLERDHLVEKYAAFIEGGLSKDLQKQIEEELQGLGEDGKSVYRMKQLREAMQNLPAVSTSPGFEQRLHGKLRAASGSRQVTLPQSLGDWRGLALAGSVVVMIITAFFYYSPQATGEKQLNPSQQSTVLPTLPQAPVDHAKILVPENGEAAIPTDSTARQQQFDSKRNTNTQFVKEQKKAAN